MPSNSGRSLFENTVLPHLDAAYNLARWLLHDDADAHDVTQESALRAWRYFDSLRGSDPLPWLLQIVRNTAFTFLDRRRREDATQSLPENAMLPDDSTPDPAAALTAEIDATLLRQAVESLPPEFREVIILRELQGLSYKQIADAANISVGTVMSRISRARKRLQLALAPHANQESDHGM